MTYHVGDKFILTGIECSVGLISMHGHAYLFPDTDGEEYNNQQTLIGVAFAVLDDRGRDALGNKAVAITNLECGAV